MNYYYFNTEKINNCFFFIVKLIYIKKQKSNNVYEQFNWLIVELCKVFKINKHRQIITMKNCFY